MPSPNSISIDKLARLIGRPDSPLLIDVRTDEDFDADPHLIPGSLRRKWDDVAAWGPDLVARKRPAVVVCQKGLKLSQGVAAWLRHEGGVADTLEDGFAGWHQGKLPVIPAARLPKRDARGRTIWVTRARPKIDRIACPWLIRRFVDPEAVFLFVAPAEVLNVADRFGATPFDIDHPSVHWSHRGEHCTFDLMVEEFGLQTESLRRLAVIVRGADTGRPEIAPESAGLLAASLGLSRMYADDLEQLEAGLLLYDAFYRWCRDAVNEGHDWPPAAKKQ
ncbi:MAG: chromate resistance protein [Proteobacteria bacterium]|nr:chromate resistance protein [Pseudomonadota bacterium]